MSRRTLYDRAPPKQIALDPIRLGRLKHLD